MGRPKKDKTTNGKSTTQQEDNFAEELIAQLNKEHKENIAFNLSTAENAPTNVKRWISTGSRQLDYLVANRSKGGLPEGRIVEIQGPASCHAAGDRVLLCNGQAIPVEHVHVGQRLLGPDGDVRTVTECHAGAGEKMYRITPARGGKTYTVTENHILCLRRARGYSKNESGPKSKTDDVINISVKEYMAKSRTFKRMYRQQHVTIQEFPIQKNHKNRPIPPYILGLLLGDGSLAESRIELTTGDKEIEESYSTYVESLNYEISQHPKKDNKSKGLYYRTGQNTGKRFGVENPDNDKIRTALRSLELLNTHSDTKFIPDLYKFAPLNDRRELIAGLLDTDGHLSRGRIFDFVSKSRRLAMDMAFMCSSVGLRCTASEKQVVYKGNTLTFHRLCISGEVESIPTRIPRKQATPSTRRRRDNQSLTGFTLTEVPAEPFYGFTLDKDQLYVTDDFSVFHNSGKSHIAFEVAKATQKMGGIVVYIDTENGTSPQNLQTLGIDVARRFVFVQTACTEEVFQIAESTIMKARAMTKDVPVTIIWDSVAASAPKAEIAGDYDQNTIGLQARVIGKGIRKIANIIGNQNVLFLIINQQRKNIGVMFGDDVTTPGGMAIPYASSVRIRITSTGQKQIKSKDGDVIGISVKAKTIKNKVARPFRDCEFQIHFGVGIVEHEEVFDLLRAHVETLGGDGLQVGDKFVSLSGGGAWKNFTVHSKDGEVLIDKKFYKPEFKTAVLDVPEYAEYIDALFDSALTVGRGAVEHPTFSDVTENPKDIEL